VNKWDERRQINMKYGKLPLKPGFNKRRMNYNDKMKLLDIEVYGS
jgi:hypothetical protein